MRRGALKDLGCLWREGRTKGSDVAAVEFEGTLQVHVIAPVRLNESRHLPQGGQAVVEAVEELPTHEKKEDGRS